MNPDTASRLIHLNHQFYQTFAVQFSRTRQRLQPGVKRLLEEILLSADNVLDLGCGNGELAWSLSRRGFAGRYAGLDFSPNLIVEGGSQPSLPENFEFYIADLSQPGWEGQLAGQLYQVVAAFAVFHHLPGNALRRQVAQIVRQLVAPQGKFILSNWQFLSSPRLQKRIQPWEKAGLGESQVDAGDYLLDWRQGGRGLRYVHHFDTAELEQLALETGFTVADTFLSDGENGQLGLYQVWQT